MKKTGLIIGISLIILALIGGGISLLLPNLTDNHVSFDEAKFGLIGAGLILILGFIVTVISVFSALSEKRKARTAQMKVQFQTEGLILFDENILGSTTYRNFHRPGSYSNFRKVGFKALIALTKTRLVAMNGPNPLIDVALTDARLRQMQFSVEGDNKLLVAFHADLFHSDWTGEIEYRFHTVQAQDFLQRLAEIIG